MFQLIISGSLFTQMSTSNKTIFEAEYQFDFIKDLSIKNILELQNESVKATKYLKEERFSELF
jgi:hypothetical protein